MDASGNQALLNRMALLRFNHTIPDEQTDYQLTDKLFGERNIICSLALKELQRLYDKGFQFTVPVDTAQMLESYHREDISLQLFIEQGCKLSAEGMVHKKDFIAAYNRYCANNCLSPYKPKEISQYIDTNLPGVMCSRFVLNGSYLWGWRGIELNTYKEVNDDEKQ